MIFFPLCLLSLFIACALADLEYPTYITVPSTVEAGSPFNATINVQWHGLADSSYAYAFRIYLGSSYEDKQFYFYDPECYLIHEQSLCDPTINIYSDYIDLDDTPITVTIPPSVGPAGAHYVLIGRILNTDGSYYGATWESDVFDLTGANGTWANYQRNGYTMWGDDGMACTGFSCVKECANSSGGANSSGNTTFQDCANACPDVDIAFDSSTYGGQPTAALTLPTACPYSPSSTMTQSVATTSTTRSSTRTAAAAAKTGSAMSNRQLNALQSILGSVAVAILVQ